MRSTQSGALTRSLEVRFNTLTFIQQFSQVVTGATIILLATGRGLSLAEIGLYTALFSATATVLELPTGGLADAAGRGRVALWSSALAVLAMLVLLLVPSLPGFLLYATLLGVSRALGSGALEAWFIDAVQDAAPGMDLHPLLARNGSVAMLGLGAGALLGGVIPPLTARFLPHLPFSPLLVVVAVAGAGYALTFLLTRRWVRDPLSLHGRVPSAVTAGFLGLPAALRGAGQLIAAHRNLRILLFTEVVIGVTLSASERFWQPFYAERFHLTDTTLFGVIFGGCFLVGMIGNLLSTPLLRLLGGRVAPFGFWTQLLQGAGLVLLAHSSSLPGAVAVFWFTYLARSALSAPFRTLFNAPIPRTHRALMLSVLSMTMFAGAAAGNLLLGQFAARTSIPLMWMVVGLGIAVSALSLLLLDLTPGRVKEGAVGDRVRR